MRSRGFTLIELLVVISIVALMIAIVSLMSMFSSKHAQMIKGGKMKRLSCALLPILGTVLLGATSPAAADTIGYWRFEGDDLASFQADSGPNGLHLDAGNAPLTSQDDNLYFPDPIPATGATNAKMYRKDNTFEYLAAADNALFPSGSQDFTIETFVRPIAITSFHPIAGQYTFTLDGGIHRQWMLRVSSDGTLNIVFGHTGTSLAVVSSSFQLVVDTSYYVAAAVDFGALGTDVTFFFQDLSTGVLQSQTVNTTAMTAVNDSTTPFRIGAYGTSHASVNTHFKGSIDEVRLSSGALSQSELLAIPEPATSALIGLGGLVLCGRRRRGC